MLMHEERRRLYEHAQVVRAWVEGLLAAANHIMERVDRANERRDQREPPVLGPSASVEEEIASLRAFERYHERSISRAERRLPASERALAAAVKRYGQEHPLPTPHHSPDVLLRLLREGRSLILEGRKAALEAFPLVRDSVGEVTTPRVEAASLADLYEKLLAMAKGYRLFAPSIDHDQRLISHPDVHAGLTNLEHWLVDAINVDAPESNTLVVTGNGSRNRKPPKLITAARAADTKRGYYVSIKTLREAVRDGRLTDHRPQGHAPNAKLLLDEEEVARLWPRRE